MTTRTACLAPLLGLVGLFTVTGCGGSSSSPGASTPGAAASVSSASSSGASTPGAAAPVSSAPASASASASVATTSATTAGHSTLTARRGATAHTASSASPAGGLAQTTGYGTYELCQGQCSGAVPPALRRPLALPSLGGGPCPITVGTARPVTSSGPAELGVARVLGSAWLVARVTWTAAASYQGPILIRGREIGGSGAVGFGDGDVPYDELQLLDSGRYATPSAGQRAWVAYTRVTAPGCYGYQIDGTDFSEVIVFRAVG